MITKTMKASEIYLKLLRWGIYASLFIPLVIFTQYLSPFHFGKMVVFRILVEIMAVIYILLIVSNRKYLPRWKPIVISFTVFTGLYALTSFTAVDFNYAFWGTLERMGGLFSFLHFWVWFIILVSVFGGRKDLEGSLSQSAGFQPGAPGERSYGAGWEKLLKISVFVGFLSILFAYGQRFIQGKFFIGWQHGERVIGTIGNPALFAGYLLFVLFLSIYFLLRKETKAIERGFYGAVFILGMLVLHMTAVRGSVIAFWGALFLLGLFYLFFPASLASLRSGPAGGLKNKKIKLFVFVGLIIFLLIAGFIWLNKNKSWVQERSWLNRITTISLKESTAQTRLWSWHSGLLGWKERPILGWGPENFVLAHAKYFDPRHFTGMGSETIWDRAHNMVLETLTTMGIIGSLSYLSIFVVIYYLFIKRFKEKRIGFVEISVFGSLVAAYFVHNLFIFDTMANYYMFFLVLGYLNYITLKNEEEVIEKITEKAENIQEKFHQERRPNPILIFVLLVLVAILIYKTNIEPARANYACTRAILLGRTGQVQKTFEKYQEALSYKSPQGKYEIRHKLATFVIQYNEDLFKRENQVNRDMIYYLIEEVKKNIQDHPLDYIPYLYIGRAYILLIPVEPELAGEQAELAITVAVGINPKNPRAWYELGQARLSQKKYDGAIEAFKRALELNPNVAESLWFLGMTYAQNGDIEEAIKYVDKALEKGYNYKNSLNDTLRLINLYSKVGGYYKIIELYKVAINLQPKNAQFYASLAATYKVVGDIENAIFYAQKAGEMDESFKEDAEKFINSLKMDSR